MTTRTLDVVITMGDEPIGHDERGFARFDYVLTSARDGEFARGPFSDAAAVRIARIHIDRGAPGWDAGDVVWDI